MKEQMHLRVSAETAGALRAIGAMARKPVGVVVEAAVEAYLERDTELRTAVVAMVSAQEAMEGKR